MPSMEYFLAHEDAIKSQYKTTRGSGEDSVSVKIKKDGYVLYVYAVYSYEYYHQTASYFEPEEESYTLKGITDWEISDIEKDSDDYKLPSDEEESLIKKYTEILTEDEIINEVLQETSLEY